MARKLMMNNIENSNIVWDYYFRSNDENGIVCASLEIPNNNGKTITVGDMGAKQIIEVTLKKTVSDTFNAPQILLCSATNIGVKVYVSSTQWICGSANIILSDFVPNVFVTIRIEKTNGISNIYFNGELKAKNQVDYQSSWNNYNGIQYVNNSCYIKEIKYKKL